MRLPKNSLSQYNSATDADQLIERLNNIKKIWILSGAGISAPSGIPTYRDHKGVWQAADPIQHNDFINNKSSRQRYWGRSMVGWKINQRAKPNAAHFAITQLQQSGKASQIVTQNVDRLHSQAGTTGVIDLHGRIDQIICLSCREITTREEYQPRLVNVNPNLDSYASKMLPDGDAQIDNFDMSKITIPRCENCGGILMPDVVFFGGTVPKKRVDNAFSTLAKADCCLIIGTSLKVFSGFRFPRWAHQSDIPIYAINQGDMRGAEMFDLKINESCEVILPQIVSALT